MSSRWASQFALSPSGNSNDGVSPNPGVYLDGTLAVGAGFTSAPFSVSNLDAFSVQCSTPTGSTLVGSVALQVSDDQSGNELDKIPGVLLQNWVTLSFWDVAAGAQAVTKAIATGAGSVMLAERNCSYRWARLVFTFTSGTGNLKATVQQKAWP